MKTISIISAFAVCFLFSHSLRADWQSDIRLTNNPFASNYPTIVASSPVLNVFLLIMVLIG
jgi:hypothetical protein